MGYIAYIISILCILGLFYLIAYLFIYPTVNYTYICEFPDKNERHCMIFLDFKKDKVRHIHFFGYFVLHRVSLAFIIVCMLEFPADQCVCIIALCLWFIYVTFNSYKECLPNFLHTYNSFILIIYTAMLPLFISCSDPERLLIAGYTCIGIIIVFFIVNWTLILPIALISLYKSCRKCCHKKTKEEIDNEERLKRFKKFNNSLQTLESQVKRDFSSVNTDEERKRDQKFDDIVITKITPKSPSKFTPKGPRSFSEIVNDQLAEQTPRFQKLELNNTQEL